jgi:glyoxylase-like metal-dependent hydrolase (beta-lactamase superfamily II)
VSVSGGRDHAAGELPVDEVAPGVFVTTAETYTTTTTVIAGDDGRCLLVDPAVTVADLAALARWLGECGLRPAAGWSTHPHWDHLLWSRVLGDVPRYATPRAAAVAARERNGLVAAVQDAAPGHDLTLFGQVEALAGDVIDWPGPRAVVYPHDAHAPGHGAVFLPDSGVLIVGDMCSDIEVPLPDLDAPDPFCGYRAGLRTLAAIPGVSTVIPGHGHPGDANEFHRRLAADLAYVDAVAAGTDYPDPRLTEDWLRTEHARALTRARVTHPG